MKVQISTIIYLCCLFVVNGDFPSHWVQPNSWHKVSQTKEMSTELVAGNCQTAEKDLATVLYKKLVNYILDKTHMQKDINGLLHRQLQLQITDEQLSEFKELTELRDIDSFISNIIIQSKSEPIHFAKLVQHNWKNTLIDWWHFIVETKYLWHLLLLCLFSMLWIFSKKYNLNFFYVAMLVAFYLLYDFVDMECNRRKEVNYLVQLMNKKTQNPCDMRSYSFWNIWFGNPSSDCKEYLLQTHGQSSCSILDVCHEFIDLFFYKFMFEFVNFWGETIGRLSKTHGVIIVAVLTVCMVILMKQLIKSSFERLKASNNNNKNNSTTNHIDHTEKVLEITTNMSKLMIAMMEKTNQEELPPSQVEVLKEVQDQNLKISKTTQSELENGSVIDDSTGVVDAEISNLKSDSKLKTS